MARNYYWVIGVFNDKPVLLGPFILENQAYESGIERLEGDFKVLELPTKDENRASRIIKAKRFRESGDLGKSLEKLLHKVPDTEL